MPLTPGSRIGPYQIAAPLGAGGMGEVYRAADTNLRRDVAIKVLPDDLAQDRERLQRFEREAQILASLSHPNIAGIYGLESCEGKKCLVLELIEGQTLAERLREGPLPVDEAIGVVRQVASALEAAHEKGIIHRDLKPGNVMVTPAGTAKILDFGLAKTLSDSPGEGDRDVTVSPTVTAGATRDGMILGTAPYMSPEQARGKPLDRRSDTWAIGCLLYECLTGRPAFRGETVTDVLSAILQLEPDWSALPASTPPRVRDLLERCLEKDARRRLRDAGDAGLELERAAERTEWATPPDTTGDAASGSMMRAIGALAAGILVGAAVAWWFRPGDTAGAPIPTLESVQRLTHDAGLSEWPTWSPDGGQLAFASNRSGDFEVYVRRVEGGQEVNVTNDPGEDYQPAFSPDGNSIAFVSTRSSRTGMVKIGATFGFEFRTLGGDVWVAPALGGRARRLGENGNFPAWSPDGGAVAYVSGKENHRSILETAVGGGTPTPLLREEDSLWEIVRLQYTPGGSAITFESFTGEIFVLNRGEGPPRLLVKGTSHAWDAGGETLHFLAPDPLGGTRLLSAGIDPDTLTLASEAVTLGLMTGILRDLAVTRDGLRLAFSELEGALNLTRLRLRPGGSGPPEEEVLSPGRVIDRYPAFSPEGKKIAFASDRLGPEEIWILDIHTGQLERLELPGEDLGANLPHWTQDGRHLIVSRFYEDGTRSLWLVATDGSKAEELRPPAEGLEGGPVSPDGREVLYSLRSGRYAQLRALDLATGRDRLFLDFPADVYEGAWSPDGEWVAFNTNASGAIQVWRVPASGGEPERLTAGEERVRHFFYSPDGRWLYYQPNHLNIYRMPASGGPPEAVTEFPPSGLFLEEPTLSPDGGSLAYCRSNGGSSLWLLNLAGQ